MQIRYNAIRSIAQTGRNLTFLLFCVVDFDRTSFGSAEKDHCTNSETSVSSSTPTSAIIYDAYTSIIKKKKKKKKNNKLLIETNLEVVK